MTLHKLYQQVIGSQNKTMPHLKVLTDIAEFRNLGNLVYFGETETGYVTEALLPFLKNNPQIIKDNRLYFINCG